MIIFRLEWLSFALTLLTLIFQNSMAAGTLATRWKRANVAPIYKRNNKKIVSNYRPVSFLLMCSKMFGNLIFNELFQFLDDRNLLSIWHQSGFCPSDSCIYQLFAMTHGISSIFDCNPTLETCVVFFDISI